MKALVRKPPATADAAIGTAALLVSAATIDFLRRRRDRKAARVPPSRARGYRSARRTEASPSSSRRSSIPASADPVALAVDPVHAGGEWIRHAPHRSDLLGWAATPTDGRWQRGELVSGLYGAEDAQPPLPSGTASSQSSGSPPAARSQMTPRLASGPRTRRPQRRAAAPQRRPTAAKPRAADVAALPGHRRGALA